MIFFRTIFAFVVILASSLQAAAQSKEDQLLDYVRANLPPGYSLVTEDFRFKDFPRNDGGRMSVAGQMVLNVDLLEKMRRRDSAIGYPDWPFLKDRLNARGYTDVGEVQRALKTFGMGQQFSNTLFEYAVVMPAGVKVGFEGELGYLETVSGIRLSGRLEYPNLDGQLPRNIREPYYIAGTVQSLQLVDQVAEEIERQRSAFAANLQAVADHFSGPLIIQGRDNGPLVRVTLADAKRASDKATWSVSSSSSGLILQQSFTGTGVALQTFDLSGTAFKQGDAVEVTVGVRVAEREPFVKRASVYLSITHPDGTPFELAGSAFPLQPWENGHARGWVQLVPDPTFTPVPDPKVDEAATSIEASGEVEADFQTVLLSSSWQGQVAQPGSRGYSVRIVPANGAFEIAYPELNCGGTWTFRSVMGSGAALVEKITFGRGCGQGGFVTLTRNADRTVAFEWFDRPGGRRCCTGRLVPTP